MEDVLTVYSRPYDAKRPVVCMDEKPYQLLADKRDPLPTRPDSTKKIDSEYERMGTCSIFVFCEPLAGWRNMEALLQRRRVDWAHKIKWLLDVVYADVGRVVLVSDNLNTHGLSLLYEVFDLVEVLRLA